MSVIQKSFGEYSLYIIKNEKGSSVSITDLGAAVQSIMVPDRNGVLGDVTVGYDTPEEYLADTEYVGATVGRFANRIGNGCFRIGDTEYRITVNQGEDTLHGGEGIHHKRFEVQSVGENSVTMFLSEPDGSDGFPGKLDITVRFSFTEDDRLIIEYRAQSDKDTVLNLTNHSYFNLAGEGSVLEHELRVNADFYLAVDEGLIPTGEIVPVEGTDFDFNALRVIGSGKYDHCYVLKGTDCAELYDKKSGRKMLAWTDRPAVQVYVGGSMRERIGKNGVLSFKNSAICLETQGYPDAPNKPQFPSTLLRAGEVFESRTVYSFLAE